MRKWKCVNRECGENCIVESKRFSPAKCPMYIEIFHLQAEWREVTEPVTECSQLPKLTAEVFDREDCPEWAKYAAVDRDGIACFYDKKPKCDNMQMWLRGEGGGEYFKLVGNGKWDATDWQNSLVEHPAKLPEWCKVGEWVFDKAINKYSQVATEDVSEHLQEVCKSISKGEIVQARLRPYNAEEIPDLPFEVTERNSNFRTTVVSCQGNKVWLAGASTAISTEELMRDFTAKGSTCGVLEHIENGEWVE